MPLKAMIIDDEPFARDDLRYMLSEHPDIEVAWEAGKFDEAKKMLAENRPDVVFLDLQLRGGSGFDLLPDIRSGTTRVIFVTAHEEYAAQAQSADVVDCLLKLVSADCLAKALTHLMHRD
jgi:two-component system LytT family response regulator